MIIDARYEKMTSILKAMAHPTRLFILDRLDEKEHCVCELTDLVGDDISTISRHLSVLRNAGLIASEKRNNNIFYRLLCPCVLDFYKCMIKVK
jgi:DNA-binding transcriptional ArsR family regulator